MKNPKISIIMPVYNAEKYLEYTIKSILTQTFSDFEFIILNDGSQDGSVNIIRQFIDPRIKFINNEKNVGYLKLLNYGITISSGKYIARMDNDDISLPRRLELQYNYLESNPDYAMVGTNVRTIDHHGRIIGCKWYKKLDSDTLFAFLLFTNCIVHPSVMIRKSDIPIDMYKEEYYPSEDFELWSRIARSKKIYNLPEVLFYYRKHLSNASLMQMLQQKNAEKEIFREKLIELSINFNEEDLEIHQKIKNGEVLFTDGNINLLILWFEKILKSNINKNIYNQEALKNAISIHLQNLILEYFYLEIKSMFKLYIHIMNKLNIRIDIYSLTITIVKSYFKRFRNKQCFP